MRSVTKSRNGCARCKRQKVRCDQVKPACGRCSRVGVECPGYAQPLKWSTKYEKLSQHNDLSSSAVPATSPLPFESLFGAGLSDLMLPGYIIDDSIELNPDFPALEDVSPCPVNSSTPMNVSIVFEQDEDRTGTHQKDPDIAPLSIQRSESAHMWTSGPLKRSLSDTSTVLTEFYFKEAASLYSVYDSAMNPFRSTVAQLWGSSRLLHCALQSMSAACLLENFPYMARIGNELRREALTILKGQQEHDHTSLLALLMIGGSSSWHDTNDTGRDFFNLARKRLDYMMTTGQLRKDSNNYHFFEEALIYWELLLAYVDDDVVRASTSEETSESSIYFPSRHIPHPWTGVARDTQVVTVEVGRLIRRCRVLARSGQFTSAAHIEELQKSLSIARQLEGKLLRFVYPDEKDVVSPGDRVTPVWHLLTLAEVYRRTGLVQLYRAFPDLLDEKLRKEETLNPLADGEWNFDDNVTTTLDNKTKRYEWLTSYTLETLRMLETIPVESGTRDFQPFLLVALCSELRFPSSTKQQCFPIINNPREPLAPSSPSSSTVSSISFLQGNIDLGETSSSAPELSMRSIDIVRTRQFILDRLHSFVRVLPPKPMKVCIQIVEESWARIDSMQKLSPSMQGHRQDVYWMDVMMDNGWETCMA